MQRYGDSENDERERRGILGMLTLCGRLLTGVLLVRFFGYRVAGLFFAIAAAGVAVIGGAHSLTMAYFGAAWGASSATAAR